MDKILGRKPVDTPVEPDKDAGGDMGMEMPEYDLDEKNQEFFPGEGGAEKPKAPEYKNPFEGNFAPAKDMTGIDFKSTAAEKQQKDLAGMQENRRQAAARGDQQTADALRRAIAEVKDSSN